MSCITESQLHIIKTSFLKILEIGKTNPDDATFLVLKILGNLDSTLIPSSLKERVVEIVETEAPATIESSLNEALKKHFLPPLSPLPSPLSIMEGFSLMAAQQSASINSPAPKKTEKFESKSSEPPSKLPPKIHAFAKQAGISDAQLKEHMKLVKIEGRLCGVWGDHHEIPEFIKFLGLLDEAAEKEELALFREGSFTDLKRTGCLYGLEDELLYLVVGFMKVCDQNVNGTPDDRRKNQLAIIQWISACDSMNTILKDIFVILYEKTQKENTAALLVLRLIGPFIQNLSHLLQQGENTEHIRQKLTKMHNPDIWDMLGSLCLEASSLRIRDKLSQQARDNIGKVIDGRADDSTYAHLREVRVEMRDDVFVATTAKELPQVSNKHFVLFHMGTNHVPGFLRKLSKHFKVEIAE